nr:hypothetical protein CFP56_72874 [Quercus suber]
MGLGLRPSEAQSSSVGNTNILVGPCMSSLRGSSNAFCTCSILECFHRWKNYMRDVAIHRTYGNKVAATNFIHWPIEIQFCEPNASTNQTKSPPSLRY